MIESLLSNFIIIVIKSMLENVPVWKHIKLGFALIQQQSIHIVHLFQLSSLVPLAYSIFYAPLLSLSCFNYMMANVVFYMMLLLLFMMCKFRLSKHYEWASLLADRRNSPFILHYVAFGLKPTIVLEIIFNFAVDVAYMHVQYLISSSSSHCGAFHVHSTVLFSLANLSLDADSLAIMLSPSQPPSPTFSSPTPHFCNRQH